MNKFVSRALLTILLTALTALALPAWAAGDLPQLPDVPEGAFDEDAFDQGVPRVKKRLVFDADQARPGDRVRAGVLFEMSPNWHIYWRSAGQGGMSTELIFDAQPGTAGDTLWPAPTVYHEAGGQIITFGYGERVILFSKVEIPEDAEDSIEVTADVDYLVCEVDCIPGSAMLTRTLAIGDQRTDTDDVTDFYFDQAQKLLPRAPEETGVDVQVRYSHVPIANPDQFRVEVSIIGCHDDDDDHCVELADPPERIADAFVYDSIPNITMEIARVSPHPDAHSGWFVELSGRASRDRASEDATFRGVARLHTAEGEAIPTDVEALFPRTESEAANALALGESAPSGDGTLAPADGQPDEPLSIFYILLLAFIGGALLNLMPCVFPVLAVKVFSFVNLVHEERQSIYLHSVSYTAGIVASMMALATVVIGLQVVGTQVGWGFQFQEPGFIAAVGAVLIIFALNLFGVFEVTLSPGRLQNVADAPSSHRRSFGEGVLAVVLATPCSAPFLGTAVGFALASSPWVIALIFLVLGLGLAMPFVVLTMVPGAAKVLPKPGPWMLYFKQFLGFALLGTAIWLVWLIGQMAGVSGVARLLSFFLACGIGVWIFGLVQFKSTSARRLGLIFAVAIISITGFFTLRFDADAGSDLQVDGTQSGPLAWLEWSDDDVQAELASGRPVFVDFTADWCITCKVNLANVLEHPSVVAAVDEQNVAMFKADWTRRDDVIRSKLAEFGKAGVPLYLMYSPDDPENPEVLPELLTRQMVITKIEEAAP